MSLPENMLILLILIVGIASVLGVLAFLADKIEEYLRKKESRDKTHHI